MPSDIRLNAVYPVGQTDPLNMPVADVARAVPFYTGKLGFVLRETEGEPPTAVRLGRDGVVLRLAQTGEDPEQASCYLDVTGLDALHGEYRAQGLNVSEHVTEMTHEGRPLRVFWLKDDDGLCYCLGTPQVQDGPNLPLTVS